MGDADQLSDVADLQPLPVQLQNFLPVAHAERSTWVVGAAQFVLC